MRTTQLLAITILASTLLVRAKAEGIQPANPKASLEASRVLNYLYDLPKRSENRIVSGHLAGGAVGPTAPKGHDGGYRFDMNEIEFTSSADNTGMSDG